jgi:RNA recognition motif-containing protein
MSQPQIEELIIRPQCSSSLPTNNQVEEHQHKLIRHLETLKDIHHQDDIKWFQRLIYNSKEDIESEDIDLGILYNLTYLDAITAKLLNIDPRKIIKAAIVKRYIRELWKDNEQPEDILESHILSDDSSRNLIETVLRPSDTLESAHVENDPTLPETNTPIETEIPEVEMLQEVLQEPIAEAENIKEDTNQVVGQDINTTPCYQTRNRPHQTINPFYITSSGKYSAGALIGNTPGDTKDEQTKYLANILRLASTSIHLIQTSFHNGNGWYTFQFEYESDLMQCLNKINEKKDENFKLVALSNPDCKKSNNNSETTSYSRKECTRNSQTHKSEQLITSNQVITKTPTVKQPSLSKINLRRADTKGKGRANIFNIIENSSYYQLRVRCATIPGNNREDQLLNLTKILQIPLESELIQITCIGRSKLVILNFENPEDLRACRRELSEQLPTCDTFICGKDLTDSHIPEEGIQTAFRITDIPIDFSLSNLRKSIQRYGKITKLNIAEGNKNFKSATVTFSEMKLDLENTWAIPLGEVMARITPLDNWEDTLAQRNTITSRLYGINKSTSATRIMGAVKHLKVKTVYIPRNNKTNRRRGFAIIGFSSQDDLQRALAAHVELFGLKTWWSTKDNQKLNNKRKKEYNRKEQGDRFEETEEEDNMSTISIHSTSSSHHSRTTERQTSFNYAEYSKEKQSKKWNKSSKKGKPYTTTPTTETSLSSISLALQDIAKRLGKLEGKEKRNRLPNRS